jgi:hypothetical protein
MFFSAALNVIVAMNFSVVAWASFMSIYAIVSKAAVPDRLRHHALHWCRSSTRSNDISAATVNG